MGIAAAASSGPREDWPNRRRAGASGDERLSAREVQTVSALLVVAPTTCHRTVVIAIAVNGVSIGTLAGDLDTTPGANDKAMHDARTMLRAQFGLIVNDRRAIERVPAPRETSWTCA